MTRTRQNVTADKGHEIQRFAKVLKLTTCMILITTLTGSANDARAPTAEKHIKITVSAAASLNDVFTEIGRRFEETHPGVVVQFNFLGSNHLQRQIEGNDGVGVDVFACAAEAPMDALVAGGFVRPEDRRLFAGNRIALVVPVGNPARITSFADLADPRVQTLAISGERVPAGIYARQVLEKLNLTQTLSNKLVNTAHVRQALAYVIQGEVSAGLVYATDAAQVADALQLVEIADTIWHDPIRYPIAMLDRSPHPDAAWKFVDFVMSNIATEILERHGFRRPGRATLSKLPSINTGEKLDNSDRLHKAWIALKLSLLAATGALMVVFPLGTLVGAILAKCNFRGRELLDSVLTLPMVLPPTVTGYYLMIMLGSRSWVGRTLEDILGIHVSLSLLGAGIASGVIAFPLMMKSARTAFESVNHELELASYTLGKGRITTLLRITLPLAKNGLVGGAILSFARAIGEFGATFMLAGMIEGRTMTMPSAIFNAFTNHDDATAQILVLVLTIFSIGVIYLTNRLNSRTMDRQDEAEL